MKARLAQLTPSLLALMEDSPIRFLDQPVTDEAGQTAIGFYGGWCVSINAMLVNDRLVLASRQGPTGFPFYGWCFPKGGAAHLATLAWDPEAQGEPSGYLKATASVGTANACRKAGERAPWWGVPLV